VSPHFTLFTAPNTRSTATATVFRQDNPRIQLACMELTPSHGTAFTFQLCLPLFHGPSITILHPIVDGPSDLPLVANPDMVIDLMERCKSTACFTHPAFIHAWAHNPHHVEVLKNLAFLVRDRSSLNPF